jgi:flagellar biosynthesis/type III secretory pathway chaperone
MSSVTPQSRGFDPATTRKGAADAAKKGAAGVPLADIDVSSVNANDLLAQLLGSGTDTTLMLIIEQMLEAQNEIKTNLQQIKQLGQWRKTLNERISELRRHKSTIAKVSSDDNKPVKLGDAMDVMAQDWAKSPDLQKKYPGTWRVLEPLHNALASGKTKDLQKLREKAHGTVTDPNGIMGERDITLGENGCVDTELTGGVIGMSVNDIEARIKKLEDDLETISQAREVANLKNQEAIQRKQRMMTLASNVSQSQHSANKAVIGNMRA